ncbi:MAG: hypothetical protein JXA89_16790 [Anaerolineae bacterium]|nr:hypothetical protein [Anaerolineae bacterium]
MQIAKREWVWVLAWGVVYLALGSLPYLVGVLVSTPDMQFSGFVYNVVDCNSYIAKMRQGARGEWLFTLPYTSEPHRGAFVYPFYIILGKVAAWSGLSFVVTYHLARLVCVLFLVASVYAFLARFTSWLAIRRIAFLLACFSSGLGWVLVVLNLTSLFGSMPIDFWVPEGYLFLLSYATPHLAFAGACLFWLLALVIDAWRQNDWRRVAIAAMTGLVLTAVLPFYAAVGYAVLGLTWLVQRVQYGRPGDNRSQYQATSVRSRGYHGADGRTLWMLVVSGLPSLPVLGYQAFVFGFDPFFSAWAVQNVTRSPHVLHLVLGYATLLALAVGGVIWVVRRGDRRKMLPMAWLALTPLLIYLPVSFQRRFLIGYSVPLALLAALGLARYVLLPFSRSRLARLLLRWPRYSLSRLRKWIVVALVVFTSATNVLIVVGSSANAWASSADLFHTRAELDALDWLAAHTVPEDVVLCAFDTGNFVPAYAGNRVFLGHGPETIRSDEKKEMVARFFNRATGDTWRRALLAEYGIAYVIVGPRERELGEYDPGAAACLSEVYANSDYAIYRVLLP